MAGRPKTPDENKAVEVGLERQHVDMLDTYIRRTILQDELLYSASRRREKLEALSSRAVAAARRRFLGALIEDNLGFEALHPVKIEIRAPCITVDDALDIAPWREREERRLLETAPSVVRLAIEHHEELRRRKNAREEQAREDGED